MTQASRAIALILLLGLPLFFAGLGAQALSDPDEPYYAVPAAEMLHTGTWAVPVFRGKPWFDKPILYYWIVLACYHVLGVTEAAARLGSAVAGLVGLLAVYALGRKTGMSIRAAGASALILGSSLAYALISRAAITDMTLTLMITLGMLGAARCLVRPSLPSAVLTGAAFGLAVLTKGPAGLLLPGLALSAYSIAARRRDLIQPKVLAGGAAGFLVMAAPWYVYMAIAHRDLLLQTFLGQENLGRFLHPEHPAFPFYYLVVLAAGLLPWSGALPSALVEAFRPSAWAPERRPRSTPGPLFLLCWFGAVLLVFSLSASKLATYILPAFPPAALLLGGYWAGMLEGERPRKGGLSLAVSAWLQVGLAAAGGVAIIVAARHIGGGATAPAGAAMAAALLAGSALAVWSVRRGSFSWLVGAQTAAGALTVGIFLAFLMPQLEPWDSTRSLVHELESRGVAADVVAAYKVPDVSLDFYLDRTIARVSDPGEMHRLVRGEPGAIWVIRSDDLPDFGESNKLVVEEVFHGPNRSAVRLTAVRRREGAS